MDNLAPWLKDLALFVYVVGYTVFFAGAMRHSTTTFERLFAIANSVFWFAYAFCFIMFGLLGTLYDLGRYVGNGFEFPEDFFIMPEKEDRNGPSP